MNYRNNWIMIVVFTIWTIMLFIFIYLTMTRELDKPVIVEVVKELPPRIVIDDSKSLLWREDATRRMEQQERLIVQLSDMVHDLSTEVLKQLSKKTKPVVVFKDREVIKTVTVPDATAAKLNREAAAFIRQWMFVDDPALERDRQALMRRLESKP